MLIPDQKQQADKEYLALVNKYEKTLDKDGNEPDYDNLIDDDTCMYCGSYTCQCLDDF